MICRCGNIINPKRVELGFIVCVECSSEQKASGHLVVHHKTGNEIEIIKNPETAAIMASMSSRNGFGCKRRSVAKEGSNTKKIVSPPSDFKIDPKLIDRKPVDPSKWKDAEWTLKILDLITNPIEAKSQLENAFKNGEISPLARKRILVILGN